MGLKIQVRGAFQLGHTARKLREAGRKDLQRQMRKGLQDAVKPLTNAVRAEVQPRMPDAYAAVLLADLDLKTVIQTRGDRTGLRIRATAKGTKDRDVAALDRGILRHPLYGNREFWFTTRIQPGFFTDPLEHGSPVVRPQLQQALADMLAKIARG